jgi:glycosyltransferase involved in cell wall biosynthesis
MPNRPRVSVILIFLNEERFLEEAIASVRAQTFAAWELLLVDDGSTDGSSAIARRFASAEPARIRYLEHPGHANLGMSAARNRGLGEARGDLVAFLDADDVWLPERLARGAALLDAHPEADMVYGRTQYWSSWGGGQPGAGDWIQPHGFRAERTFAAPELLRMYLDGEAALPCMGSLTLRRRAAISSGGFIEAFRGLYEDQAFLANFCLDHSVYVSDEQWDRYRQHADSACASAARSDRAERLRQVYHDWLAGLLEARGLRETPLWESAARARVGARRRWPSRMAEALRRSIRRFRPAVGATPTRPGDSS